MTASLRLEVQSVFDRFITTELATIDNRGQPITCSRANPDQTRRFRRTARRELARRG